MGMSTHAGKAPDAANRSSPRFFDAVLQPNCSLTPRGFRIFMVGLCALSTIVGLWFFSVGAWPVVGFLGLDVLVIWWALKSSYRAMAVYERVRLDEDALEIERVRGDQRIGHWRFEPTWLNVSMDDPPEHESRLTLSSHGKSLVIGAFLTPQERLEVATALKSALARWRDRHLPVEQPAPAWVQ